ncbi:spermidine synthase family protein [Deinococcus radiophilus]|uniref:Uncharacterized protein n=1 Tax=Deinococcus radiophilus TaxID=32062 RepID=A0A3S0KHA7_9DEIO|nr:hypothetical protein [Deinococcus radiophilus]RTR30826.1 hypothetical protein EJ104_00810 [Deinococcus radiophilus]UFA49408.1 hypothetical protein LMT64_05680 [Deinococcus radiophilus]
MTLPPFALPLLALASGYLVTWFLWGVWWPWLLVCAVIGALAWAEATGSGRAFGRSVGGVALAGATLWGAFALVAYGRMALSPHNPLPFGPLGVLVSAALPASVLAALWWLWRTRPARTPAAPPLAPWLWLLGAVALALFPPVRIDCRGMKQTESFLKYDSGFTGFAGENDWSRHPEQMPGRSELPADWVVGDVDAAITHCSRPLSFRASEPLLVAFVQEPGYNNPRSYAAVFTPGDHERLTPWTPTTGYLAQPSGTAYTPYLWPVPGLDTVYPVLPALPPELARALPQR